MQTYCVAGTVYPVTEHSELPSGKLVPVVDMPMTTDKKWQRSALQSRMQHPAYYAGSEDVQKAIEHLQAWLSEHTSKREGAA